MKNKYFKFASVLLLAGIFIGYQNCGGVAFTHSNPSNNSLGNNTGTTSQTLKSIQPTLAVRGLNCMACHGVIGSNVITDFGYGSANFNPLYKVLPNVTPSGDAGRDAFNNIDPLGGGGGWQNLQISGTLHIPQVTTSPSDYNNNPSATSLLGVLSLPYQGPNPPKNPTSMIAGITPPPGAPAVQVESSISISYPSKSEILNLLPANLQGNNIAVAAIQVSGLAQSSISGLDADPTGQFIQNSSSVSCYGDVVVKGPLFLNNLKLQTDGGGCRLYVSGTVFIQGPITYTSGSGSNIQISSASAIVMGMSTTQMGASSSGSAVRVSNTDDDSILTVGGPFARFAKQLEPEYNPSGAPINGVPSSTFFDNIVSDAKLIGSQLVDAGEPGAINNLVPGESIVTETGGDEGNYGGQRVAINYTGLLLNAPHVHSRYGGTFQGVVIADVAMLARNPSNSQQIEQFVYDPTFNTAPVILPALSTNILNVVH